MGSFERPLVGRQFVAKTNATNTDISKRQPMSYQGRLTDSLERPLVGRQFVARCVLTM